MGSETKQCQNCRQNFTIEPDDFAFYEKIKVPPPTFCPGCRFQRRLMFRNERTFHWRKCDLCGINIITIFAPEKNLKVYCSSCWWSDKWDDGAIYLDYDPNKHIFEQMRELQRKAPHMALVTDYSTLVNSDYVNHAGSQKNCYLVFNGDYNENVAYSNIVVHVKDSMDCVLVGESELMYQVINGGKGYNCFFSEDFGNCSDIYFCKDMHGCMYCLGCHGLRNKNHCIFNKQYSKEEWKKKMGEFQLNTYSGLKKIKQQTYDFWIKFPHRWMHGSPQNINSTGEYVFEAKNALNCYQARQLEDARYCQFITMKSAKDIYDLTEWGNGVQRTVDSLTVGEGCDMVKYCAGAWHPNTQNVEYGMYNVSCQNCFACINLKKKQYRILNKQYTPEKYKILRENIIKKMNAEPYTDSNGRIWKYGEFLPYDLSPFAYNESHAIQYWQLTKEKIEEHGWKWREPTPGKYTITMPPNKIPDSIHDTQDSILDEVLGCITCEKAFRLIKMELEFLRHWRFPVPRQCPNCRHMARIARMSPPKLWHRSCMCSKTNHHNHLDIRCPNEFETSYAPERQEIIYCEKCYQQEVY